MQNTEPVYDPEYEDMRKRASLLDYSFQNHPNLLKVLLFLWLKNLRHPFNFLFLEFSPFVVPSCDISLSNLTMNSCEVCPQPQLWSEAMMVRSDMSGLLYRWSILSLTDLAAIWSQLLAAVTMTLRGSLTCQSPCWHSPMVRLRNWDTGCHAACHWSLSQNKISSFQKQFVKLLVPLTILQV